MMGRSHVMIGVSSTGMLMAGGLMPFSHYAILAATIGSLSPDIDTPYSTLGRRIPFISMPLYRSYGHRTATHALPGLVCAAGITAGLEMLSAWSGVAFFVGYVMHILADLLTKEGCAALYPFKTKRFYWWPSVRTGSFGETVVVSLLMVCFSGIFYELNPFLFDPDYIADWIGDQIRSVLAGTAPRLDLT